MGLRSAFEVVGRGIAAYYTGGASEVYFQAEAAREGEKAVERQVQAQREQRTQQKKLADIKANRERRRLAREARIARSQILVATRGESSSRSAGVTGSIGTQVASQAGFQQQQETIANNIFASGEVASQASADIASSARDLQTSSTIFDTAKIAKKSGIFK